MYATAALLLLALARQNLQQASSAAVDGPKPSAARVIGTADSVVGAVRTTTAPTIDGKDDDAVWKTVPEITGFQMWRPSEGKEPRFKTSAKIAYDAANLYVIVRAYDPHPDSIIKLL